MTVPPMVKPMTRSNGTGCARTCRPIGCCGLARCASKISDSRIRARSTSAYRPNSPPSRNGIRQPKLTICSWLSALASTAPSIVPPSTPTEPEA
jgi:hypothetical protein